MSRYLKLNISISIFIYLSVCKFSDLLRQIQSYTSSLKSLKNFPVFLGESAYETLSDMTIAYFSNFIFPRHPCVSHLSVFPLIHSSALHHTRTEKK